MNYRHIAIEGNIGAGKSTLAKLLAKHYGVRLLLEEFEGNNFLPKFYNEPERYAFPLELSFLADRYKQQKNMLLNHDLFQQGVISDYLFFKCKLFARVNLKEDEYELFQKLFDIMEPLLPRPDLIIYLHSPVERLLQNIKNRGRLYEQVITDDYLIQLQDIYDEYLKHEKSKLLTIDMSTADFVGNSEHFRVLLGAIDGEATYTKGFISIGL